jgi:NAD(P)-dependent dehydrogenase (short-subunit alcohol dehydrogenase family)
MAGPVILVTGSTDGIGKATAAALLKRGAEVILHGRSAIKGEAVQKEQKKSGLERSDLVIADFSDMGQVRSMAADIISRYSRLDVLVNNAGTYRKERELTQDGTEMTFAVNYLGPFLLTHLLLPLLQKSAPSRIVTVASGAHEDISQIDWNNLPAQQEYDPWDAYALSKFADVAFTFAIARRLERSGVTANCLHPGVVNTKLVRFAFPGMEGISPEEGAKTSVYLALSPSVAGISGKYFDNRRLAHPSPLSQNHDIQERLFILAQDLTGIRE